MIIHCIIYSNTRGDNRYRVIQDLKKNVETGFLFRFRVPDFNKSFSSIFLDFLDKNRTAVDVVSLGIFTRCRIFETKFQINGKK